MISNLIVTCVAAILLCAIVTSLVHKKPLKAVARDFFADVAELGEPVFRFGARLWRWAAPRVTNKSMWMALVANVPLYWPQIAADPTMQKFLTDHPSLYLAGAFIALMASRQHGTLRQLPPDPSPTGGYVNNVAIA